MIRDDQFKSSPRMSHIETTTVLFCVEFEWPKFSHFFMHYITPLPSPPSLPSHTHAPTRPHDHWSKPPHQTTPTLIHPHTTIYSKGRCLQDPPGHMWTHKDLLGPSWNPMEGHGMSWNMIEHAGTWWNQLETTGTSQNRMECYRTFWNVVE
jgi:hypothetical protein